MVVFLAFRREAHRGRAINRRIPPEGGHGRNPFTLFTSFIQVHPGLPSTTQAQRHEPRRLRQDHHPFPWRAAPGHALEPGSAPLCRPYGFHALSMPATKHLSSPGRRAFPSGPHNDYCAHAMAFCPLLIGHDHGHVHDRPGACHKRITKNSPFSRAIETSFRRFRDIGMLQGRPVPAMFLSPCFPLRFLETLTAVAYPGSEHTYTQRHRGHASWPNQ